MNMVEGSSVAKFKT